MGYFKIFFASYIKMSETTNYQRNKGVILNRAKEYYKNNKEVLKKEEISIEKKRIKKKSKK